MPTRADTLCPPSALMGAHRRSKKSRRRKRRDPDAEASTAPAAVRRIRKDKPLSRKWVGILLLAVCAVSVVVGLLAFDSLPSIIGDNAEFVILARSLAAGNGFRYIHHPDNRAATKYPLGFPAMLAGWISVFGDSVKSMKVCVLACFVVASGLTFMLGRRLVGWSHGLLASLLVALSATVVAYSHQVLSDVPYMFLSMVGIYLVLSGYRRRWYLLAGLAVCVWAFMVRSAGFSLVLSAAVFLFLKGRKKEAVVVVGITALIAVLWSLRNQALTGEGSRYMQVLLQANPYDPDKGSVTFSGLVNRVLVNAGGYLGGLLPATVLPTLVKPAAPGAAGGLNTLASMLVMVVVLLGGYSLRKEGLLTNIYMLLYFAVYLLWPEVWKSDRFMVPLAPLLAIYLVSGLRAILAYFGVKRVAILTVCALVVATNLFTISRYARRQRGYPAGWVRYFETAQWAGANTDPAAIVMCRKPFLFHLFSNRRTIGYPFTRDQDAMRKHLYEARPDFVVLDNFGGGGSVTDIYVVPVLEEMTDYLSLAYETKDPVNKLVRLRLPDGTGR